MLAVLHWFNRHLSSVCLKKCWVQSGTFTESERVFNNLLLQKTWITGDWSNNRVLSSWTLVSWGDKKMNLYLQWMCFWVYSLCSRCVHTDKTSMIYMVHCSTFPADLQKQNASCRSCCRDVTIHSHKLWYHSVICSASASLASNTGGRTRKSPRRWWLLFGALWFGIFWFSLKGSTIYLK